MSSENRILIWPAIIHGESSPIISFLDPQLKVFRELEVKCRHSEELILHVFVIELVLQEVNVLVFCIWPVIVVLNVFSRPRSVKFVSLERFHCNGTRNLVDIICSAIGSAGLTVVANRLNVVSLDINAEPVSNLIAAHEIDARLVQSSRFYDRLSVVVANRETERIAFISALDGNVIRLHVAGTVILRERVLRPHVRHLHRGIPPCRNHSAGIQPGTPRVL